ncbi:hypothetical protein ACFSO9_00930 [Mesonia maritima]|uniref:COG1470 family protein n=1 Tax=Mesonia maritima TaxID=1793873 RepID=UPI003635B93F
MQKQQGFSIFFAFIFFNLTFGQSNISFELSEKKLQASNGEIVSFYVKLVNYENEEKNVFVDFKYDEQSIRLANTKESAYSLYARDSIFIPIKGIIAQRAEAGKTTLIEANLLNAEKQLLHSEKISVNVEERKMIRFYLNNENLIFENIGDTLSYEVRIDNLGNTKQRINLLSRFPKTPTSDQLERKRIEIESFHDTIIKLTQIVDKKMLKLDDFEISLKALYDNGDIFGTGRIHVNSVKQSRRYQEDLKQYDPNSFAQNNIVSFSGQKSRDNYQYFFYANNQFQLKKGTIQSNIDLNWWQTNELLLVRNTWVKYDSDHIGVKAGNLFRSDVVNLIGRGVEGYYKDNHDNRLEIGGLNKSYTLINNTQNSYGNAGWVDFSRKGGWLKDGYNVSMIYDDDPNQDYKLYIGTAQTNIINKEKLKLKASTSVSRSELHSNDSISKDGAAAELIFFAKKGRFTFNSNNYASSGYYAGLRKGALNFTERLTYNADKFNFWGLYNYLRFDPKQLNPDYFTLRDFTTVQYSLGVSRRMKKFSISLVPNYYIEERSGLLGSGTNLEKHQLKAKRVSINASYNDAISQQNISFNWEGGYYSTDLTNEEKPHFKFNLNYNWKFFNLSAYYQYNSFFLGEVFSKIRFNTTDKYEILNLVPTLQKSFFDNKLQIRGGVSYTSSTFTDPYLQLNGRIDYQLPANFNVYFSTFMSDFSTSYYNTSTMQFGVIKRFSKLKIDEKRHDLKVYVYYNNQNDSLVRKPAAGELLLVNGKAFRTNDKGMIRYKRLPEDSYNIHIFNTKEWYAADQTVDLIDDTEIIIGMDKTVTVKGNVSYKSSELSYNVPRELSSLTVTLINQRRNF